MRGPPPRTAALRCGAVVVRGTVLAGMAALATTAALAVVACGEKEERLSGPARSEVRALVAAGLAAAGSDTVPSVIAFRLDGSVLRVRAKAPRPAGPLLRLVGSFRDVRAEIVPFCPKPALLRCRPAFRAWASRLPRAGESRSVAALRRLAARIYGEPTLIRRRGGATGLATANGELLAVVRATASGAALSFGGVRPRRAQNTTTDGRLRVAADAAGLASLRPVLPPSAQRALAGARRLVVWLSLGRGGATSR